MTITDVDNARNSTMARATANVSDAAPVALVVGGVLLAVLFVHETYPRNWTWTGFVPSSMP